MKLITRRKALLAGAGLIASPAIVRAGWLPLIKSSGGGGGVTGQVELIGTQISSGNSGYPNLVLSPQKFTSTSWTPANSTLADAAVTSPDGTTTGSTLTCSSTAAGVHIITTGASVKAASSIVYAVSCYLKAGHESRAVIQLENSAATSGAYCVFDLSGVQVGVAPTAFGTGFSASGAAITSVGSGWCLCSFNVTSDASTSFKFAIQSDHGTGTGAISNYYAGVTTTPAISMFGAQVVGPTQTANLLANLIDGSGTTWWEDYSPLAWAGVDMGSSNAATFTGAYFTPRAGNSALTDRKSVV